MFQQKMETEFNFQWFITLQNNIENTHFTKLNQGNYCDFLTQYSQGF